MMAKIKHTAVYTVEVNWRMPAMNRYCLVTHGCLHSKNVNVEYEIQTKWNNSNMYNNPICSDFFLPLFSNMEDFKADNDAVLDLN